MRVISGMYRGLKLNSLDGLNTRPTLDNVKEAIFSMLFDKCTDAKVLDLFSGSGALGIEALSRYGKECVFCDNSQEAINVIRSNVEKIKSTDKSRIVKGDYLYNLETFAKNGEKFDIIFLDPPYAQDFMKKSLDAIYEFSLLSPCGVIVCEFDYGTNLDIQNYNVIKNKKYGRVCINILEAQWIR